MNWAQLGKRISQPASSFRETSCAHLPKYYIWVGPIFINVTVYKELRIRIVLCNSNTSTEICQTQEIRGYEWRISVGRRKRWDRQTTEDAPNIIKLNVRLLKGTFEHNRESETTIFPRMSPPPAKVYCMLRLFCRPRVVFSTPESSTTSFLPVIGDHATVIVIQSPYRMSYCKTGVVVHVLPQYLTSFGRHIRPDQQICGTQRLPFHVERLAKLAWNVVPDGYLVRKCCWFSSSRIESRQFCPWALVPKNFFQILSRKKFVLWWKHRLVK